MDHISEENVLWFLDTALLYNIRTLRESCLEFIQTNPLVLNAKNLQHIREGKRDFYAAKPLRDGEGNSFSRVQRQQRERVP